MTNIITGELHYCVYICAFAGLTVAGQSHKQSSFAPVIIFFKVLFFFVATFSIRKPSVQDVNNRLYFILNFIQKKSPNTLTGLGFVGLQKCITIFKYFSVCSAIAILSRNQ